MATAKCLRRQAATCAALVKQTDDEESRQRYIRLELLYLQLADSEEQPIDQAGAFTGDNKAEAASQRSNG